MKKAKYIVLEGTEGCGKTTQCRVLVEYLRGKGFSVLETKEPGTPLCPVTVELRKFVLDAAYGDVVTPVARELITQAIRSIHLEKVIVPALSTYDYIIQDRGLISGMCYGEACGHDFHFLMDMGQHLVDAAGLSLSNNEDIQLSERMEKLIGLYDNVIVLTTKDVANKLATAQACKKEYQAGDFIEAKGEKFMDAVNSSMNLWPMMVPDKVRKVTIDGKDIKTVALEIKTVLGL